MAFGDGGCVAETCGSISIRGSYRQKHSDLYGRARVAFRATSEGAPPSPAHGFPRAEPRDLVDVLFVERNGYAPERDLGLALLKDSGVDPGILAWLLRDFPVQPLPQMLMPLSVAELSSYRDELAERLRLLSLP